MVQWIDYNRIILNDDLTENWYLSSLLQKFNSCLEEQLPDVEKVRIPYFTSEKEPIG